MTDTPQVGIVLTDVDGTLVDNEHHPIPASAEVICRVAARIPFCLVSARSPEGLYPIQRQLGFAGPMACFSGAYVLDHEGNELYSSVIPTADALEIKRYLEGELPRICAATYGFHHWIVDDRSDPRIVREEYFVQAQSVESRDLAGTFGDGGVHKFLLMGEPKDIVAAQATVAARYPDLNVVRSNDIDMLMAVEQSYAMANGEDSVKQAAAHVVPWTNEECGVARMLQRQVLGE